MTLGLFRRSEPPAWEAKGETHWGGGHRVVARHGFVTGGWIQMEKSRRKLEKDLVIKGAKGILNFPPLLERTRYDGDSFYCR
jgi:hypothetical protein